MGQIYQSESHLPEWVRFTKMGYDKRDTSAFKQLKFSEHALN